MNVQDITKTHITLMEKFISYVHNDMKFQPIMTGHTMKNG